jgi:type II secretory pathway pseudopilin PulG
LVVIAVIAVLMGILMPALNKAKKQAQSIACQGNLKGYTLATAMYAQENNDNFVNPRKVYFTSDARLPGESISVSSPIHHRWYNSQVNLNKRPELGSDFFKYLANAKALICPTFKTLSKSKGGQISGNVSWHGAEDDNLYDPWHNYTMNAYLGPKNVGFVAKTSQVKNPSTVFVFADEGPYRVTNYINNGLNDTQLWVVGVGNEQLCKDTIRQYGHKNNVKPGPDGYGPFVDGVAGFHGAPSGDITAGAGNCTFVDGHIGPVRREDAFTAAWPK